MAIVGNISKIPELRKRIFYTLLMLGICRLGIFISVPGVNPEEVRKIIGQGMVFGMFNLFSGGALDNFSVMALGIMPYISASIIFQLLSMAVPSIEALRKEGESGYRKINQYTRYATVALSIIQGLGISFGLERQGALLPGVGGISFYVVSVLSLMTGTLLLMWIGEQITERGLGNGISLIIFAGIVARLPQNFYAAIEESKDGASVDLRIMFFMLAVIFAVIALIVYCERAHRRVPVQYAKRVVGNKLMQGQASYLPLKINMAGVIPPIFAQSLISFPAVIAQFSGIVWLRAISDQLNQSWLYNTLYAGMIIFFTFFYTAVTVNPADTAENIQKNGGYIPGIRPGKATADYLDRVITRITVGGSLYLALICLLPQLLTHTLHLPQGLSYTFGGTSLLIMVGVAMDTIAQMEAHLLSHQYEGVMGSRASVGRFRGRRA